MIIYRSGLLANVGMSVRSQGEGKVLTVVSPDEAEIATPAIHLVRHGHHPGGFRGGWSRHSLSRLGRIQSSLLANRLRQEGTKVNTFISSDLPRAGETADILAQASLVSVSFDDGWREVNNGVLAGLPDDKASSLYPGLFWPAARWRDRNL